MNRETFRQLLHSNSSPESIALGTAVGVFICVLPLYGFHTLIFIGAIFLLPKANKIAMFLGTNVSLPPTLPFITWAGYEIGRLVFWQRGYPPFGFDYFRHFDMKKIGDFYLPLFVGSVILGVAFALLAYAVVWGVLSWKRQASLKKIV